MRTRCERDANRQCRDKINFTVNIDDKLLPTTAFGIEKFVEKYDPEMEQRSSALILESSSVSIRISPPKPFANLSDLVNPNNHLHLSEKYSTVGFNSKMSSIPPYIGTSKLILNKLTYIHYTHTSIYQRSIAPWVLTR
jgi:hypothetical protein